MSEVKYIPEESATLTVEVYSSVAQNTFRSAQTVLGSAAVTMAFPGQGSKFYIYHLNASTIAYLGETATLTAGSSDSAPMAAGHQMVFDVKEGNENAMYGIVSTGNVATMYVVGFGGEE